MHIFVRMTIHFFVHGFSSCTFLYEWLSTFIWVFVMHIFVRITIYLLFVWVFVMHISVQMTIHILMGFCHAYFCTNENPYSSCMGFRQCTFLYERLSIFLWVFVMHIYVRMTIHFFVYGFLSNRNSEFLGIFSYNVSVSPCAQYCPTRERRGAVNAL